MHPPSVMGRARVILQSEFPYNVSGRCINREWFHLPMERVWEIFCQELTRTSKENKLQVHSFVLMSNHFHLICSTPHANISRCMHQFMFHVSRRLTREGNRINQTFAGRHFKCILQHHSYFLNAYKYNYRNPVAAGLCERVEDYPYITLYNLVSAQKSPIPLCEDLTFISDPRGTLRWLNTAPDPEKLEGVRYAFKHQFFKSKKDPNTHKPLISEHDTL